MSRWEINQLKKRSTGLKKNHQEKEELTNVARRNGKNVTKTQRNALKTGNFATNFRTSYSKSFLTIMKTSLQTIAKEISKHVRALKSNVSRK